MSGRSVIVVFLLAALATAPGCALFHQPDAASPAPETPAAPGLDEGRIVRLALEAPKESERALLARAIKTLHQTQQLGLAASRARSGEGRILFDYLFFDADLQAMIAAIEEYLITRDTGPRTPRPVRTLRLDYTSE